MIIRVDRERKEEESVIKTERTPVKKAKIHGRRPEQPRQELSRSRRRHAYWLRSIRAISRHFSTFIYRVLSAQTNQPNFIFITRYRIALETSSCLSEEILIAKCVLEKLLLNKVESEIRPIRRKKRKMKLLSRQIAINWDFNYRMNDLKIRFEFENIR